MPSVQDIIHKMEEGSGREWLVRGVAGLALVTLFFLYDFREFKNLATEEALDTAQLARNISQGKGFTTDYVRPFSMYLLKQKQAADKKPGQDVYRIREAHPDIANPPLYPLLLAGWMKIMPMRHEIDPNTQFMTHQPDLLIGLLNQILFIIAAVLVFLLARRVFDTGVAWVSAFVFLGAELYWRFSVSGLPTMLLLVFFLGLVWVLVRMEEGVRAEQRGFGWVLLMALGAGVLLGLGALTRYSFAWLAIPAAIYCALFLGRQRIVSAVVPVIVCLAMLAPWTVRNYHLSGALFGTAGYAIGHKAGYHSRMVEGSLNPEIDLRKFNFHGARNKLTGGIEKIVKEDLIDIGGSWLTGLFLAGLLIPFRSLTLSRLRVLLLLLLGTLIVSQALGRTHLLDDHPELSTENQLALAAPLVFIFGVGMFYILLGQLRMTFPQARLLVITAFILIASAPLVFTLLPPRSYPVAYPPYFPPVIQRVAKWTAPTELLMTDVPAGLAWYGQRRSVGLTYDLEKHFYEINDYHKPIAGVYLTPVTLDGKFLSQLLGAEGRGWGLLMLESIIRREVPGRFPLRVPAPGFFPDRLSDQFFLTDRDRWTGTGR
jgi:4-amino-4-deoxy-L-arabinose transferase-like glycosyltransferase